MTRVKTGRKPMTIDNRIKNAQNRGESTLNLSFSIADVEDLCGRWNIDPNSKSVRSLVEKIRSEIDLR